MAGIHTIGEKNALMMQRGNVGLVVRACLCMCTSRCTCYTGTGMYRWFQFPAKGLNELSNVYNPLPFSFINTKARVIPNSIGIITEIGPYFRVRPNGRSHIIIIIIGRTSEPQRAQKFIKFN